MSRGHDEQLVIVYWSTQHKDFIIIPVITNMANAEESALNLLKIKHNTQILKNIYKIDYKGNVTKFKDLVFENPNLINKIRELTGK